MSEDIANFLNGSFIVDPRDMALYERLEKYYIDTPDSMSNQEAMTRWADFRQWCAIRGYTEVEINHAKIVVTT